MFLLQFFASLLIENRDYGRLLQTITFASHNLFGSASAVLMYSVRIGTVLEHKCKIGTIPLVSFNQFSFEKTYLVFFFYNVNVLSIDEYNM